MKKKPKAKARPPGRCVFCGRTGMTREHILSDWINEFLPAEKDHFMRRTLSTFVPADRTVRTAVRFADQRQGGFHQRMIRNVCGDCNNGWMSRAVALAKPALERLLKDEGVRLEHSEQLAVALWSSITAVMGEYTDRSSSAIGSVDRAYLRQHHQPPPNWLIFFGRTDTVSPIWFPYHYKHSSFSQPVPTASLGRLPAAFRGQITTVTIKHFVFYLMSFHSKIDRDRYWPNLAPDRMVQIWPRAYDLIEWPATPPLTEADLNHISGPITPRITFAKSLGFGPGPP